MKLQDVILPPDTIANQPDATDVPEGSIYCQTDSTPANTLQRSNGTTWDDFAPTSATATGGLILIEKKLITSDSTSTTFSSLNGNADIMYKLIGHIKLAGNARVDWQPNGTTTNQASFRWNSAGNTDYSTLVILSASTGDYVSFELSIQAAANPNSQSYKRSYTGIIGSLNTSNAAGGGPIGGGWNETSTNITSIVIAASAASAIANGSTICLYKYAQS